MEEIGQMYLSQSLSVDRATDKKQTARLLINTEGLTVTQRRTEADMDRDRGEQVDI